MAWQTVASADTRYAYTYLQYDDSSTGSSRSCRIQVEVKSGQSIYVYFDNVAIDGGVVVSRTLVSGSTTLWSGSLGAGNHTVTWSCPWWDGTIGYSMTGNVPSAAIGPSGASMSYVSCTWNSVTVKGKVTSWGNGGNASRHFAIMNSSSTASAWGGRLEKNVNGTATTDSQVTISNSSYDNAYDGGLTIKGCTPFRVGMWYGTDYGSGIVGDYTTRYTPPSPLASASATVGSYAINDRKWYVAISATGGSSTNNQNVNVNTYYRYKTSSSSTWGSWTLLGTGTPWTTKSTTLKLDASTAYNFQFYQVYQNQGSSVYSVNITTPATPDVAILYVPVSGRSKKITKLYFSLNGVSKRLTKLYASVNGVAKRIF